MAAGTTYTFPVIRERGRKKPREMTPCPERLSFPFVHRAKKRSGKRSGEDQVPAGMHTNYETRRVEQTYFVHSDQRKYELVWGEKSSVRLSAERFSLAR